VIQIKSGNTHPGKLKILTEPVLVGVTYL